MFGFNISNKWRWFGLAAFCFLAAWLVATPIESENRLGSISTPDCSPIASAQGACGRVAVPGAFGVQATRTPTAVPTAWATPTVSPPDLPQAAIPSGGTWYDPGWGGGSDDR